jgi:hypothetical protein
MLKILSSTASCDSAMKLRTAIETQLGLPEKTILVSKSSNNCKDDTVLLRYGCSYGELANEPEWGDPEFTRLCIDKRAFAEAIGDRVEVPSFHNDHLPTKWPVILRSTLTGSKSEGITICHNKRDMQDAWKAGSWWTPYIPHSMEIRVIWVTNMDYQTVRIYKKVPRESDEITDEEFICGLNGADNTKWILKDLSSYPKVAHILATIEDTLIDLGGKFVGLDMIYSDNSRDWVILEGNSGPWLSDKAAEWLAGVFIEDQDMLGI